MTPLDVQKWMAIFKKSWEELDTDLLMSLFTKDAAYQTEPFAVPFRGPELRKLWDTLSEIQSENHIESEVWFAEGDLAIVHWWGESTHSKTKERRAGDGVFHLRFVDGRCRELREWQHWHLADEQPVGSIEWVLSH